MLARKEAVQTTAHSSLLQLMRNLGRLGLASLHKRPALHLPPIHSEALPYPNIRLYQKKLSQKRLSQKRLSYKKTIQIKIILEGIIPEDVIPEQVIPGKSYSRRGYPKGFAPREDSLPRGSRIRDNPKRTRKRKVTRITYTKSLASLVNRMMIISY